MDSSDYLEFRHLRFIIAIAKAGTFTAAAASLPLAQPSLSHQIGQLEDALGILIFKRAHRGSTLTDAGEALLGFAHQLLDMREDVIKAVRAIHQATMQPFRLGFTPFVDKHVLGTVSQACVLRYPPLRAVPSRNALPDNFCASRPAR